MNRGMKSITRKDPVVVRNVVFQNVRVGQVALGAAFAVGGRNLKSAAILTIQERRNTGSESKRGRQHQTTSPVV